MDEPFEIPGIVRVERAKPYRTAVATEALLSDDRTASHYQVGAPDAMGKRIVLGEQMTYVDWRNSKDVVWRLYEWHHDEDQDRAYWKPMEDFTSRDLAVNEAASRAASIRQVGG